MRRACPWLSLALLVVGCSAEPVRLERSWPAFGHELEAEIYASTERVAVQVLDEMQTATLRIQAVLDPFDAASELSELNRRAVEGPYAVEDRDLYGCVSKAVQYAKASGGSYDPTTGPLRWDRVVLHREALAVRLPHPEMQLDLGAMIPGYTVDVLARVFARIGTRAGRLTLGHSAYAWGGTWLVALPDPRAGRVSLGKLRLESRGATVAAGIDMWDRPTIDARRGERAGNDVLLAVAVADSAADSGALATALFVGGSLRAGSLLEKTRRVEALLLVAGERETYLMASASLQGRLELSEALLAEGGGKVRYLLPPTSL